MSRKGVELDGALSVNIERNPHFAKACGALKSSVEWLLAQLGQQPTADEGADDSDADVRDEAVNGDDKPKPKKRGKAKKPEPKKKPTKTPTNLGGYRAHVRQWVTRSGART